MEYQRKCKRSDCSGMVTLCAGITIICEKENEWLGDGAKGNSVGV